MKKVAVFGNAGGGKSTLSKRLSEITGLPLYILDKIQYQSGGAEVPYAEYKHTHEQILAADRWIIDGFGCVETLWLRLNEADSLVFVDLPLYVHFWWVTKRLISGSFIPPEGWPENSPILKSSTKTAGVPQSNGTPLSDGRNAREAYPLNKLSINADRISSMRDTIMS